MRYKLIQLLLVLPIIIIACNSEKEVLSDSWNAVQQTGQGTVVLHYVPSDGFSYDDEDGFTTGVTIDLFRDFVEYTELNHNVEIELVLKPIEFFSNFYQTVVDGYTGEFGVANVTITEERRNELAFSPHYLNNIAVLITHSDVEELDSMVESTEVFSGLKGLAFESTLHESRIREIKRVYIPDIEIDFAHSNNEIIDRVSAGNNYFSYVDIYNYWRASEQGAELKRHSVGDDPGEMFGVIMPHGSDWQEVINDFFAHNGGYIYSDRYREILETHLGSELTDLLIDAL